MSMTETIKLYDRDAYAIEFEADVISCEPNKADDKQFDIILNQTLFFPEEGGQSPDMGILGGFSRCCADYEWSHYSYGGYFRR